MSYKSILFMLSWQGSKSTFKAWDNIPQCVTKPLGCRYFTKGEKNEPTPKKTREQIPKGHHGIYIRLTGLDVLTEGNFLLRSSHWDSVQKIYCSLNSYPSLFYSSWPTTGKFRQTSPSISSCVIFSRSFLKSFKRGRIWAYGERRKGSGQFFSVLPSFPT